MTGLLFNIKDLAVLMSAFIAVLFGLFFLKPNSGKTSANKVLGLFLLAQASTLVLSILLYGHPSFKANNPVRVFFLGAEGVLIVLEGFLLYWYTKTLLFKGFTWGRRIYAHIMLILLVIGFAHVLLYLNNPSTSLSCPSPELVRIHIGYTLLQLVRCVYAGLCFANINRYQRLLEDKYSNTDKIDLFWLKLLIGGYLIARIGWALIPAWRLFWYYTGYFFHFGAIVSIIVRYSFVFDVIWLITLSVLLYFALHYSPRFEGFKEKNGFSTNWKNNIKEEHISRAEEYMQKHKPYLSMDLKLDDLAEKVSLPPKTLSTLLNIHYKKNFCEFINHYRIKEAISILSNPQLKDKPILDIAMEAGFSSKSAFNRSFRKETGVTPVEYKRRAHKSNAPPYDSKYG